MKPVDQTIFDTGKGSGFRFRMSKTYQVRDAKNALRHIGVIT